MDVKGTDGKMYDLVQGVYLVTGVIGRRVDGIWGEDIRSINQA